jgi:hypothetical protein
MGVGGTVLFNLGDNLGWGSVCVVLRGCLDVLLDDWGGLNVLVLDWSLDILMLDWGNIFLDWGDVLLDNWGDNLNLSWGLVLVVLLGWGLVLVVLWGSLDVLVLDWGDVFLDNGLGDDLLDDWLGNNFVSLNWFATDLSVESVVVISGVVNDSAVTVSVDQRVLSWDGAVLGDFVLLLDVSGMGIMDIIVEFVVGWFFVLDDLLDQSWLHDLLDDCWLVWLDDSRGLVVLLVLWFLMIVVIVLVLGWCNSDQSEQSDELKSIEKVWEIQGKFLSPSQLTLNAISTKWIGWCVTW